MTDDLTPDDAQPLRKHHFSKPYNRPSTQRRAGGAIYTTPARDLAAATSKLQSPVSSVNQAQGKFWIVPDRSAVEASRAKEMHLSREMHKVQSALQTPDYPPKTLPTYNHQAVALQLATDTPFIVPPETASERNITNCDPSALATMTFFEASARWLESRRMALRERAFYMYGQHLRQLNKYFGNVNLEKIHVGHMSDYQTARTENRGGVWTRNAGPSIINHELSAVQQVLKRAKLWAPLADIYEPLPLPASKKQKVLDEAEEHYIFTVAASRPEWELAFLVTKMTRNTTAAGCELRNLRIADVILDSGEPRIVVNAETAKNQYRGRVIPLNPTAKATIEQCMERAKKFGSHLPEHYIFPKRLTRNLWDPYKPASSSWLRTSFIGMRDAAGFPWLTPHCFRHMAITNLLEKGIAPETVRSIAGHVSEEMMRHYSHIRHAAQMGALNAIDSTPVAPKKNKAVVRAQKREFMARGRRHQIMRRPTA